MWLCSRITKWFVTRILSIGGWFLQSPTSWLLCFFLLLTSPLIQQISNKLNHILNQIKKRSDGTIESKCIFGAENVRTVLGKYQQHTRTVSLRGREATCARKIFQIRIHGECEKRWAWHGRESSRL